MFNESLFSSKTDEWSTPKQFFNEIVYKYGEFDLDPCCTADSAKAKKFYTKEDDGLSKEWMGKVWMNPPYGKYIKDWMRKAYESSLNGAVVFCLVPARTDTEWWHKYAMKGDIIFIKGRLKFGGSKTSAPFPSVLIIFNYQ
jgi:phage N-6-adenine-methyltransferase